MPSPSCIQKSCYDFLLFSAFFCLLVCSSCPAKAASDVMQNDLHGDYVELKQLLSSALNRLTHLERNEHTLKGKVDRLEEELTIWKNRVELLENKMTAEKGNQHQSSDIIPLQSTPVTTVGKTAIYRTCRESRSADPSLNSGMYWIDPDGVGVGDDPIYVYCNMTTGSTSILHDSEEPTDVGHCADPGCYSKSMNYQATTRQIKALVDLSESCQQSIQYDCNYAPMEANGVTYSWWNDKNGNPQYFWAGSNSSVHTCQCGIDHNCIDPVTVCNCDANLPIPQTDQGVILRKDLLPVTRLNFGRTLLNASSGVHTLGRLECTGRAGVQGMPSSCTDLWRIGNTLSGLYSVKGSKTIDTVYCDFSKLPDENGFQTWIGETDVKSRPVYFYLRQSTPFSTANTPIPFPAVAVNIGGAMNATSGIFTAPRKGLYYFAFTGNALFRNNGRHIQIFLRANNAEVGSNIADGTSEWETLTIQSTLHLQVGDTVWLSINSIDTDVQLGSWYSHFTGWLIQEDF